MSAKARSRQDELLTAMIQTAEAADELTALREQETAEPAGLEEAPPPAEDPTHSLGAGELVPILEALLFVSPEPLMLERGMAVIGISKTELLEGFHALRASYESTGSALQVVEVAGGFRLVTRPEYAPWLKRLEKVRPAPKLSRSALESLAIIAYKQPIVRSEIEQIRGVETSGVLRTLLERKLVRMVGRKEVPGRPIMYGTTKFFLEHFGLRDLSELPPLREFKELGEAEQALLPVDDPLSLGRVPDVAADPLPAEPSISAAEAH